MSERTNLNISEKPRKYVIGSIFLLILSGIGLFVLNEVNKKEMNKNVNNQITKEKAKEGEFCGAGTSGVVECVTGLTCQELNGESDSLGIKRNNIGAGGICRKINDATKSFESSSSASETTLTLVPSINLIENFESNEDKFGVKYEGKRKMYEENEISGKRYIFYSSSGNITVHVGKTWSWINSGREFTDSLLVGGEKSYIYEISNQKIVDLEKNDKKYTIQCVHNAITDLKTECDKFLEDFYFI
ncbi:MAG TPA: hypothetical protein VN174_00165 [Candidatus Methanoperedens sp.]|nr:hypothetical protein [Candidatus Methanoperedens sp.]